MKKQFLLLAIAVLFCLITQLTVYVTKTGTKYHASSCRYLSQSKIPMALELAKQNGYGACKVCKPGY